MESSVQRSVQTGSLDSPPRPGDRTWRRRWGTGDGSGGDGAGAGGAGASPPGSWPMRGFREVSKIRFPFIFQFFFFFFKQ